MDKYIPPKKKKKEVQAKRRCQRCRSTGRAPCQICGGTGQVIRGKDYNGHPLFGRCEGCLGVKTTRCSACGGEGFI